MTTRPTEASAGRGRTRTAAETTRRRLVRAAEQLFAEHGVDGARTRDITERAGQANSSALHYHFGSRDGLLRAILAEHQARVERALAVRLAPPEDGGAEAEAAEARAAKAGGGATELTRLVAAYIEAEASELRDESGRDCLRIVSQLAHETGFRDGRPHETLAGGMLWGVFTRVAELVRTGGGGPGDGVRRAVLPDALARERVELMVMLVGSAFADRARHVQAGRPRPVEGAAFRADLVRVVVAMLTAPGPS
ncbi:TetR/AcrR family transcriptional regulator [Streptodolium elevatio]